MFLRTEMRTVLIAGLTLFVHVYLFAQSSEQSSGLLLHTHICNQNTNFTQRSSYAVPLTAKIHHLKAEWVINPPSRFIEGHVHFQLTALVTDSLQLALHSQFQIDSIQINNINAPFRFSNNVLKVSLQNANGGIDTLSVHYRGEPKSNASSFVSDLYQGIPIVWTLSQPYGASDWWPNFQNLKEKIDSIDVFIHVPSEYTAVSNGLLQSKNLHQNKNIFHWKHNYPIPSYLIALAVSKYDVIKQKSVLSNGDSLQIEDYLLPDDSAQIADNVSRILPILTYFDSLLITYPFAREKYGHAQFTRNGGMEHTTISFINNYHTELLAHELAHHWFGNYITCSTWQDIWLNEGFATYLAGRSYAYLFGDSLYTYWRKVTKERVCSKPDGSVFVYDTSDVKRVFDARLSYNKAAFVLIMLEYELGEESFLNLLRTYLNDPSLAYSFASTNDFKQHAESISGKNLDVFFQQWIYNEGFPYFSLQWHQNHNKLTLEISQNSSHTSNNFFEMKLPIGLYGHGLDTILDVWVNQKQQTLSFDLEKRVETLVIDPESRVLAKQSTVLRRYLQNDIFMYPNPADAFIEIVSPIPNERIQNVQIYSLDGRCLIEVNNIQLNKLRIDIQELKLGIYVVHIETSARIKSIKLNKNAH